MNSKRFNVDLNALDMGLNPLLPMITGVIENLEETTMPEIQRQVEIDMNRKLSETDLRVALENGIKLGVLEMRREFKVCREFSSKELRPFKRMKSTTFALNKLDSSSSVSGSGDKKLMQYVNYQRDQRKKKLNLRRKKPENVDNYNKNISEFLCQKCQESVEKEFAERSSSDEASTEYTKKVGKWKSGDSTTSFTSKDTVINQRRMRGSVEESLSEPSGTEKNEEDDEDYEDEDDDGKDEGNGDGNEDDDEKDSKKKSRLLVRKNPLETEPPYYDIFT